MSNKISVITVVYNDVEHIRQTMESFFSQSWEDKEYIVIDGGSTDGTAEIIKEYADRLHYWCSEKDHGIYDAMNKGIAHATGDWVNFLNCGDYFVSDNSLSNIFTNDDIEDADIIYGNSIEIDKGQQKEIMAEDYRQLEFRPVYRHGSSLTRRSVIKEYPFETGKKDKLGFALDWNQIFQIYHANHKFKKVNVTIQAYDREGTSNQAFRTLCYNYKITTQYKFSVRKLIFFTKCVTYQSLCNSAVYRWAHAFLMEYVVNDILPHIPFWSIRKMILKFCKTRIGKDSFIMKRTYFLSPSTIEIGNNTTINRGCFLDGRGQIKIGNDVSISHEVKIVTGSHDVQSSEFSGRYLPVHIKDHAWLGIGCTILPGITIGEGAVVAAGAVVTKNVNDYEIVAGLPARKIGERNEHLKYHCIWDAPFT